MKTITSPALQQQQFKRAILGGYRKKEVNEYLKRLADDWEKLATENDELHEKLAIAQSEIKELRQIESSLLGSLKEQQEANKQILEQARNEAKLRIAKGQIKANNMLKDAEVRSKKILQEAQEKYNQKMRLMRVELKTLEENYQVIDQQTGRLISEMATLMRESMKHLNRLSALKKVSLQREFSEAEAFLEKRISRTRPPKTKQQPTPQQQKDSFRQKPTASMQKVTTNAQLHRKSTTGQSFFDEVAVSAN